MVPLLLLLPPLHVWPGFCFAIYDELLLISSETKRTCGQRVNLLAVTVRVKAIMRRDRGVQLS